MKALNNAHFILKCKHFFQLFWRRNFKFLEGAKLRGNFFEKSIVWARAQKKLCFTVK